MLGVALSASFSFLVVFGVCALGAASPTSFRPGFVAAATMAGLLTVACGVPAAVAGFKRQTGTGYACGIVGVVVTVSARSSRGGCDRGSDHV